MYFQALCPGSQGDLSSIAPANRCVRGHSCAGYGGQGWALAGMPRFRQRSRSKWKRNDRPCERIQPAVGVGKWLGMIMAGVSAKVSRNRWRVVLASSGSTQKQLLSCGSAHWSAVCMMSPLRITEPSGDRALTHTCPGVCPGHGSIHALSSKAWSLATSCARPLSMTGSRLSS